MIGHSLGAHIAGMSMLQILNLIQKISFSNHFFHFSAGKKLQTEYRRKLRKIVGLDPAGPLFNIEKPEERLHSNDAIYVETVHTSTIGFFSPLGDVDFYPNGGQMQPQCGFWNIVSIVMAN